MVRPLDCITLYYADSNDNNEHILPEPIPLSVLYEDEAVLVINKPAGLVVHPGPGNRKGTLLHAVAHHFHTKGINTPLPRYGLVHRIDKHTSGILVLAKTTEAIRLLVEQFAAHSVHRKYTALVWGSFNEPKGCIRLRIGRDKRHRQRFDTFPEESEEGKNACTHYEVAEDLYYVSLIHCRLETGRTHQIRVHMRGEGHPVFGDATYGGTQILKGTRHKPYDDFVRHCFDLLPRQALHASELGFIHPLNNTYMHFTSSLPNDFQQVLHLWKNYFSKKTGSLIT